MKQGLAAGYFPSMRESFRLQMPSDKDPLTWLTLFLQWKGILLLGFCSACCQGTAGRNLLTFSEGLCAEMRQGRQEGT